MDKADKDTILIVSITVNVICLLAVAAGLLLFGQHIKGRQGVIKERPRIISRPFTQPVSQLGLPPETQGKSIKKPDPRARNIELWLNQPVTVDDYQLAVKLVGAGISADNRQYADMELYYSGRDVYDGQVDTNGNNGYVPNPNNYPALASASLLDYAKTLYRTHRLCTGEINPQSGWRNGKAVKDLSCGYKNYTCSSRFYEQCFADQSFDGFYEEHCDFGVVRFFAGEEKRTTEYSIKLLDVSGSSAQISIDYIGSGVYEPMSRAE